jgi:UDPglucose 6-dehydrogenase
MRVSVFGLGKLGSPLAAILAHKGHTVIGVDVNADFVRRLNEGMAPVDEPGLQEMVDGCWSRLSATMDAKAAVLETDLTFLIVPTPSGPDGRFSLRHVLAVVEAVGTALREKAAFHLVSLTSTVMPGHTGGEVLPALERASGKKCGRDFGLCYNPEFIALGSVINGILYPDFVLIGESDPRSGEVLEGFYKTICMRTPPVARMGLLNAELTKLAVNTYVTTKISYANMLAEVCERLPEADVDVVTAALGLDTRIGRKYLRGALGFGGPCFPRDNVAFCALARGVGSPALLAEATEQVNRAQLARLERLLSAHLPRGGTVGILGLAYKPDTPVVEESPGLLLAMRVAEGGTRVIAYDPAAMGSARMVLGDKVAFASSAAECAEKADVLVLTTPWEEFKRLDPASLKPGAVVVDCWRVLPREKYAGKARYLTLGRGPHKA